MHLHIRELQLEIVRRFDNSYIIRENNWAQSGFQATHNISNCFFSRKGHFTNCLQIRQLSGPTFQTLTMSLVTR